MTGKTMRKLIFAICLCFLMGIIVSGGVLISSRCGSVRHATILYIPHGTTYEALLDSLETDHRTRHHLAFRKYAKHIGLDHNVKPGRYELKRGMSYVDVARMLNLGMQTPVNITFNNIRTPEQLASKLAPQIEADSAALMTAFASSEIQHKVGTSSTQELFGLFLPNTYEVYWTMTPEDFVERMKREYDHYWTPGRLAQAELLGLSRKQISTLASIVYEETAQIEEMPVIAGVYINRLRKCMPLQADPTIRYALGDFTIKRVTHEMLKTPSPYNTYLNAGLPPTPICMPSMAAIDAVLNYTKSDYLYFCAKEDLSGYHNFAATYKEHLANAKRYAKTLDSLNIQ